MINFDELDRSVLEAIHQFQKNNGPDMWRNSNYPNKWPFSLIDLIFNEDFKIFRQSDLDAINVLREKLPQDLWADLKSVMLQFATSGISSRLRSAPEPAVVVRENTYTEVPQESDDYYFDEMEIDRFKKSLGISQVIISAGSRARTFHKTEFCTWMNSGRIKSARNGDLPSVLKVSLEEAVGRYKRRPCDSCFASWWAGKKADARAVIDGEMDSESHFSNGQRVTLLAGPFQSLQGIVLGMADSDGSSYKVLVNIFGRETPVVALCDDLEAI
jgi:hypothetical protein